MMAESNSITRAISVNNEAIATLAKHMDRYADFKNKREAHGLSDIKYLMPILTDIGITYGDYSTDEATKVLADLISSARRCVAKSKKSNKDAEFGNEEALRVQLRGAKIDSVDCCSLKSAFSSTGKATRWRRFSLIT